LCHICWYSVAIIVLRVERPSRKLAVRIPIAFYSRRFVLCGLLSTLVAVCLFVLAAFVVGAGAAAGPAESAVAIPGPTLPPLPPTPTPLTYPAEPVLLTDPVPDPHADGVLYFPETGHTLRGKFLDYWQGHGGLDQFGYPLTEEFFESNGPDNALVQVQYFERNRVELHPENQPPNDVLLGRLGIEFHPQDRPAARQPSPSVYFPETGHNLSGKFLDYWQQYGGLAINGYPISEPAMETSTDGKQYLTQWFERARLEEHPENVGTPYEVLVGQLGRQLSEKRGYPYGWYPSYGRAPDYSWASGLLELRTDFASESGVAGCSVFRFDPNVKGAVLQLDGPTWPQFYDPRSPPRPFSGDQIVVFGRFAMKSDQYSGCPIARAPGYILYKWQWNPAQ
jgi:hypothetical protein